MKNDVYAGLNIMQRHQMVNGFANDVIRKLGRETVTKQREDELIKKGIDEGVNAALFAFMRVIWKKWGKCNKKVTRMKVAFDEFNDAIKLYIEHPDEIQLEVEAEFTRQTGCTISREKVE